jgi:hypothetical protein
MRQPSNEKVLQYKLCQSGVESSSHFRSSLARSFNAITVRCGSLVHPVVLALAQGMLLR